LPDGEGFFIPTTPVAAASHDARATGAIPNVTQTRDPKQRTRIERYDPASIEPRWQARWDELGLYKTDLRDAKNRYYLLTMFAYPSGDLHIGHWYIKTPTDALARFQRMHGKNVFLPIGFDAFGLPAENAAIKNNVNPRDWTMKNIENMRRQLRSMGATFDWDSEVVTADPDYYRWNQWFFLQFLKAGLAYRQKSPVDWCPNDGTLAREQVEGTDRHCWRCGAKVEKRELEQWYLRVTKYADELLDFSQIEFPDPIRAMQTNWIGRSEGGEITFETAPSAHHEGRAELQVFTTRPDTLFGATFMVLAPEHPLVETLTAPDRRAEVEAYIERAAAQTEIERLSTDREKTGVAIGADAINPVNGERIPIFVADYVLGGYGTGAIMAVPAHDERDYGFAVKFGLPIRRVVARPGEETSDVSEAYVAHADDEILVNSGAYSGLAADEGGRRIIAALEAKGLGRAAVTYRLRDWVIGRQRYWGTPIPIIYCSTHGAVPVPEEDLPVRLPDNVDYAGSGVNPLTRDESFLNVPCPICGEPARRETDTLDTFIDSSWYWYRYLSPHREDAPFDPDLVEGWTPVEQYTGGAEHAVMHLLYAREWTKMMRDIGLVQQDEPWRRVFNQGQILGMDGERMSKSRGNTVDPDHLVARYGADTVRLFLMFMGPWDQGGPWTETGIAGVHRFLRRVWALTLDPSYREPGDPEAGTLPAGQDEAAARAAVRSAAHRALRDVTADYEAFHFNTMLAKLMELSNTLFRYRGSSVAGGAEWDEAVRLLLLMLAPAAPHIAEELWSRRLTAADEPWRSIHTEPWPEVDQAAVAESSREVPVQVNGKVRDRIVVAANADAAAIEQAVLASARIRQILAGRTPDRIIQAGGGRLVNLVVRD
jgi:leucyl-tRNA synthetase